MEEFIGNEEEFDALVEAFGGALALGAIVASEEEDGQSLAEAFGASLAFGQVLNTMSEEET